MTEEQFVNQEVRVRILENAIGKIGSQFDAIDKRFDRVDDKLAGMFNQIIFLILASIVIPVVLHYLSMT